MKKDVGEKNITEPMLNPLQKTLSPYLQRL